jgi:hypothetical protein
LDFSTPPLSPFLFFVSFHTCTDQGKVSGTQFCPGWRLRDE